MSETPGLAARLAAQGAPLRQASLCFLLREGDILLARKKRGFGIGKWNGVGGKPEPGETIEQTAIREAEEEIGVTPCGLRRVATLDFLFPQTPEYEGWDQQVCVYVAADWTGEPIETEEVAPRWFARDAIPYEAMWADDLYWLPYLLRGIPVYGQFLYDDPNTIREYLLIEGIAAP
jgi:8-oxo-dGTP pyrophosphatase MutT (NUDIX family)